MKTGLSVLLLLSILLLSGCAAPRDVESPTASGWQHADLRLVLPDGETAPDYDLVAASIKLSGAELLVRLDVLDMQPETRLQAYLVVDDRPGGSRELPFDAQTELEWDLLVSAPPNGPALMLAPDGTRTQSRLPWLATNDLDDTLIFHLPSTQINAGSARFQAFVSGASAELIEDSSPVFAIDGQPPAATPLLLAFWNSLPAGSAAQVMRRWNGAHTGPEGHRHGLYQLLRAAEDSGVPVALLDLKNPESLAGLDLVGGLDLAQRMDSAGLLLLPEAVYGDPQTAKESLELTRRIAAQYGFATSKMLYGPADAATAAQFQAVFSSSGSPLQMTGSTRRIFLPDGDAYTQPATATGPALEIRRALLAAARSGGHLVVLGGSLPDTAWADAVYAGPTLHYFARHAWINPLDAAGVLALPAQQSDALLPTGCADLLCTPPLAGVPAALRDALQALPAGTSRDLALQMYLQLTRPAADPQRAQLQANLLPQVHYLITAANWDEKPAESSDCQPDPRGGEVCILASQTEIAILHSHGARLVYLGSRGQAGLRQWIGPSSQFAAGLGDASQWKLDAGEFSDSRGIPGAFVEDQDEQEIYQVQASPGEVVFTAASGAQKRYRFEKASLIVEYAGFPPATILIPLAPLPQARQQPGWSDAYALSTSEDGKTVRYGIAGSGVVQLNSSGPAFVSTSFFDAGAWLRQSEDPDHAYPPGHFQPVPLAVISAAVEGSFTIRVSVE